MARLAGWQISMEKSPLPSDIFNVIGVVLDLRPVPEKHALIAVTPKRIASVTVLIKSVLRAAKLSSGEAASLTGKLGFTITATFG